jgi:hypothetical protein
MSISFSVTQRRGGFTSSLGALLTPENLHEREFRGKDNRRIQYAILTSASVRGGLEPDLLDEVVWWYTGDYRRYALYAAVALIRAGADRQSITIARMVEQLADRSGVTLT